MAATLLRCILACSFAFVVVLGIEKSMAGGDFEPVGPKWEPWIEFGGYYNSDDASRGEVALWAPIAQSSIDLFFFDARANFFERDVREGNFAVGYRTMLDSGYNLGAWIGADARSTAQDNGFWQLSGGLEALSRDFDARVNVYGPVTGPQVVTTIDPAFTQVRLEGNNIFLVGGREVALQGVDGELGVRVPLEMAGVGSPNIELRLYGGAFHFDDSDAIAEVSGGKGRVELRINEVIAALPGSRLTAEYEFSHDNHRDERHEVGARLRIPFGDNGAAERLAALSYQEARMMDGLERDTDIITVQSKEENVEDVLTGVDFDRVAYVNGGGSITAQSAAAGDNSLLIVNGTISGPQELQGNQTLQGGGSTIQVRGLTSGVVLDFTAPGSKPTLTAGGGFDVLTLLGSNTHVNGLGIDGDAGNSGHGIFGGDGKSNVFIRNNMIMDTGRDGIRFGNENDGITIAGNMIDNVSSTGIRFDGMNSNVVIASNTITMPGSRGIHFDDDNVGVTISDTTISDTNGDGIFFDNRNQRITISNSTINNAGSRGIEFDNDNTDITIIDSTINNADSDAIDFLDRNQRITIANVTIESPDGDGIEFDDDNTDVTIRNVTINNPDDDGIDFDDRNERVLIENVIIDANDNDDGMVFGSDNTDITIRNSFISNAGFEGIEFESDNANITIENVTILNSDETAIEFDDRNTNVLISNVLIDGVATEEGIFADNNNEITIVNSTIRNTDDQGIEVDSGNTLIVRNTFFENIGNGGGNDDAIDIEDNNNLTMANNLFGLNIGAEILDVNGAGNTLSGTGNDSLGPITCESGTFAGTATFLDGTVFQDGVAPCN